MRLVCALSLLLIVATSSPQGHALATSRDPAFSLTPPLTSSAPVGTTARLPTRQGMLSPGTLLPGDEECASRVRPQPEKVAANKAFNRVAGRQSLSAGFFTGGDQRANTLIASRVTGNFTGTTDEIIQWVACKWGIDEDIVRAQIAVESKWRQSAFGDWHTDPQRCPPGHEPGVDGRNGQCPQSWGLMQVKYRYYRAAWPAVALSTAFNLDTAYAVWRACYEGYETWLNQVARGNEYAAGDAWGCIGRWYAGKWQTQAARTYIAKVQNVLATRTWELP